MMTPDRVRALALALPGATERETWGKPTFRVGDRLFATLSADGSWAAVKATCGDQVALVAANPEVFSVAPYAGRFGWVAVKLDRVDQDEFAELLTDAWRQTDRAGTRPGGSMRLGSGRASASDAIIHSSVSRPG